MNQTLRDLVGGWDGAAPGPVAERVLAHPDGIAWFENCVGGFAAHYGTATPEDFLALDQAGIDAILEADPNPAPEVRMLLRLLLLAASALGEWSVPFPVTRADGEELLDLCSALPEPWWALLERGAERLRGSVDGDGDALLKAGYRVLSFVGRGGVARVYRALQLSTGNWVALKVMDASGSALRAERTRAEVRHLGLLDHPGIPKLLDVTEFWSAGRRCQVLVQEFVEGRPITELETLRQRPRELVRLFLGACKAVEHAHDRHLLHRDLHPGNILIDAEDRVRVIDFGISKLLGSSGDSTHVGTFLGTPSYSPPEQLAGQVEELGPPADVYSLGAVLYRLLSGRAPHERQASLGGAEAVRLAMAQPVTPLTHLRPELAKDLGLVVMRALAEEPEQRYADAGELAADLQRFLERRPVQARPATLGYRLQRYLRRQPVSVVVGLAFVAALTLVWNINGEAQAASAGVLDSYRARLAMLVESFEKVGSWDRVANQLDELEDKLKQGTRHPLRREELRWLIQELRCDRLNVLGEHQLQEPLRAQAVEFFQAAVRQAPTLERRAHLARSLVKWGDCLGQLKRTDRRTELYAEALRWNRGLVEEPGGLPWLNDLFWSEYRLARDAFVRDDIQEALELLPPAQDVLQRLKFQEPGLARTLHAECSLLQLEVQLGELEGPCLPWVEDKRGRLVELTRTLRLRDTTREIYWMLMRAALDRMTLHLEKHYPNDSRIPGLRAELEAAQEQWASLKGK